MTAGHRISGSTRVVGVIGDPVRHSLSPTLYNAAFQATGIDWVFVAYEVPAGGGRDALDAMRTLRMEGLSVTMPHKTDVADAVDELSPDARALRSVNHVARLADGRLFGDSTDGEGFVRSLREAGFDPASRRVLVVGAGGAARAVVLGLARSGAHITVAARRDEAAHQAASLAPAVRTVRWSDRAEALERHDLIVNATSVGMAPAGEELPVDPGALRPDLVVADLVYHPLETPLLRAAREAGALTIDGLGMLVHQAALQFEGWTGRAAPFDVMRNAVLAQ